jgi:hypothetical protein
MTVYEAGRLLGFVAAVALFAWLVRKGTSRKG